MYIGNTNTCIYNAIVVMIAAMLILIFKRWTFPFIGRNIQAIFAGGFFTTCLVLALENVSGMLGAEPEFFWRLSPTVYAAAGFGFMLLCCAMRKSRKTYRVVSLFAAMFFGFWSANILGLAAVAFIGAMDGKISSLTAGMWFFIFFIPVTAGLYFFFARKAKYVPAAHVVPAFICSFFGYAFAGMLPGIVIAGMLDKTSWKDILSVTGITATVFAAVMVIIYLFVEPRYRYAGFTKKEYIKTL